MIDSELYTIVRAELIRAGIPKVFMGRQPVRLKIDYEAVYIFPVAEIPYGWQQRHYAPVGYIAHHKEWVRMVKTMQAQVFDSDLAAILRMTLVSLPFVERLHKQQVGISAVSAIRNPAWLDESDNYRPAPSLDFDLDYNRTLEPDTPAADVDVVTVIGV